MYKKLRTMLKKPNLYEKSIEKFWTDPHISKEMLKSHLDPNTDLASRRPDLIEKAIDLITSLVPSGGKVLDIGCGPGLYTKRLSEKGFCVTGIDFSQNSIEFAKAHDDKGKYRIQNYLEMDFCEEFDMIILIWCDYGALIPSERKVLLKTVYTALKPGGLFLFDAFTLSYFNKQEESSSFEICEKGGFWSSDAYISFYGKYKYDENVLGEKYIILENEKERIFNLWTTCFSKKSINAELENGSFIIKGCYSGIMNKRYEEDSELICVVAEK
ncbi:MAG: methyltransferase domain-containing protein [Holosporales bacterium]|nr:methyltransferase domain-containing protein [Holosporales bacterium]